MWVFYSFIALENLRIVEFSGQTSNLFTKILRWAALTRLVHNFRTYPDFLDRSRSWNENVYSLGYNINLISFYVMAVSFNTVREIVNVACYKHRLQKLSMMCLWGVGVWWCGVGFFFFRFRLHKKAHIFKMSHVENHNEIVLGCC